MIEPVQRKHNREKTGESRATMPRLGGGDKKTMIQVHRRGARCEMRGIVAFCSITPGVRLGRPSKPCFFTVNSIYARERYGQVSKSLPFSRLRHCYFTQTSEPA
jgi:hypothetical protein